MDTNFCISHKNLPPIFTAIITNKLATLYELRTVYYYEEALNLYELILVNNYNEMTYNEIKRLEAEAQGQ